MLRRELVKVCMPLGLMAFAVGVAWLPIPSGIASPRWWVGGLASFGLLLAVRDLRPTTDHLIGAAFVAWCALSLSWSVEWRSGVEALIHLSVVAAAFCVASRTLSRGWVWVGASAACAVNLIACVAQSRGLRVAQLYPTSDLTGLFGNKNFMGEFAAVALVGAALLPGRARWCALPPALLLAISGSRGAMVAAAAGLCCLAPRGRFWRVAYAAAGAGAAVLAVDSVWSDRVSSSLDPRLEIWSWTWANLSVLGTGLGTYADIFPWEHAFNDLAEYVFEVGIGATLVVWLVARLLRGSESADRAPLVAGLVASCFAFTLHQPAPLLLVAVAAGGCADTRRLMGRARELCGVCRAARADFAWALAPGAFRAAELVVQHVALRQESEESAGDLREGAATEVGR